MAVCVRAHSSAGVGTHVKAKIKFAHACELQPNNEKKHVLAIFSYLKSQGRKESWCRKYRVAKILLSNISDTVNQGAPINTCALKTA